MTDTLNQKEMKVIVFQLVDMEYAVSVDLIQSIEKVQSITRVPKTPAYVKGVINLRGIVTPIVDLRERFGLASKGMDDSTRIIIVRLDEYDVGLVVDAANDVLDIPVDAIEPQPKVVGSIESDFISGVANVEKHLLVMLNLDKVLEPVKRVTSDEF